MAEIIDLLTCPVDNGAMFTVNIAVDSVDLVPVTGVPEIMYAGLGTSKFTAGDSFIVLSTGYFLPESFVMAVHEHAAPGTEFMSVPALQLYALDFHDGLHKALGEFGNNGILRLPFSNYELSIGVFVNPIYNRDFTGAPMPITGMFQLSTIFPFLNPLGVDFPQVSMQGVPVGMDGKTYYVTPFVKVLHNKPLRS